DRTRRVEARPAVAHRVADVLGTPHPEEALLLAREGRIRAVLPERARTDGDRRLAELRVAARELGPQLLGERREAHRLADRLRRLVVRAPERGRDRPVETRRTDELAIGRGADRKAGGHRHAGSEKLAQVRALAAELDGVVPAKLGERARVRRHAPRISTTPFEPSTRI